MMAVNLSVALFCDERCALSQGVIYTAKRGRKWVPGTGTGFVGFRVMDEYRVYSQLCIVELRD